VDRRQFLSASLLGMLAPGMARAIGSGQAVRLIQLQVPGLDNPYPDALARLAMEVRDRTSVTTADTPLLTPVGSPLMAESAFAVLTGRQGFHWQPEDAQKLARWLQLGGFLVVDLGGSEAEIRAFEGAVRRELGAVLAGATFERVSLKHVLFRSFYRLNYPAGRVVRRAYVEAIPVGNRLGVVLSHNDLLGTWSDALLASGDPRDREMAVRFGVNLLLYGLCLHYKDDQVHLDYLLHKRNWKISPPEP
jgi:hypothetical protein